jgi:hypothetical protein
MCGHRVTTQPCDGVTGHWRVTADGTFCGLIACDRGDWRTLPVAYPGRTPCGPVCHCPDETTALETLLAETIDH